MVTVSGFGVRVARYSIALFLSFAHYQTAGGLHLLENVVPCF